MVWILVYNYRKWILLGFGPKARIHPSHHDGAGGGERMESDPLFRHEDGISIICSVCDSSRTWPSLSKSLWDYCTNRQSKRRKLSLKSTPQTDARRKAGRKALARRKAQGARRSPVGGLRVNRDLHRTVAHNHPTHQDQDELAASSSAFVSASAVALHRWRRT